MENKNILIVFTDSHLPYSPTVLNIFNGLRKKGHSVKMITLNPPDYYAQDKIEDNDIIYISEKNPLLKRVLKKILIKFYKKSSPLRIKKELFTAKADVFVKEIKKHKADTIIAIDFFSLWCVQQTKQTANLVSLEIYEGDVYYQNSNLSMIDLVIIQSVERYNHLFPPDLKIPSFIYPNSPVYNDFDPKDIVRDETHLIFCGSAVPDFGIISILDFLLDYHEFKLTIKGPMPKGVKESIKNFYQVLVDEKRLFINEEYMDADVLTKFVARFRIGFVFYDFYRYDHLRTFNYYTAPSGKLFQYLNSGVPVITNKIAGFKFIEDNNAGRLIPYLSSLQIKSAIDSINQNYDELIKNSKMLSKKFDNNIFTDSLIDNFFLN